MQEFKAHLKALGTSWTITSDVSIPLQEIQERLETFENNYSRFRENSLVGKISRGAGAYALPDDAEKLFEIYRKLYDATNGMVTPLMGKVLSDAGYDAGYSLKPKENVEAAPKWEEVMEYKYPSLVTKVPVFLDFGAAGKGYAVDIVSEILMKNGLENFMINAGGDIYYKNESVNLKVGLENPTDVSQAVGVAEILNQSLCGSAGNRRAWGNYTHIINPKTIESPKETLAVWVVADSTILADGLTTALFFIHPDKLNFKFEYAIVYKDKTFAKSKNFPGEFFV